MKPGHFNTKNININTVWIQTCSIKVIQNIFIIVKWSIKWQFYCTIFL